MTTFDRQIVAVEPQDDGSALVTYDCGHSALWVIPPQGIVAIACAQCVNEFVEANKVKL